MEIIRLKSAKKANVTNYKNITVAGDQIETANIVLVPGDGDGETAGEFRIVLTWGRRAVGIWILILHATRRTNRIISGSDRQIRRKLLLET